MVKVIEEKDRIIPDEYLWKGTPGMRKPNISIDWITSEHRKAFVKCHGDFFHFVNNYVYINGDSGGIQKFKMYDYQKKMAKLFLEPGNTVCNLPRQVGKTTSVASFIIHYVLFNSSKKAVILCHTGALAQDILGTIKAMYVNLPFWMKPGIVSSHKSEIVFENGSSITAKATTENSIRGNTADIVVFDEYAFVEEKLAGHMMKSIIGALSERPDSKLFILSTPRGMNHFYKLWRDNVDGGGAFKPYTIKWNDHPNRGKAWKEEKIKEVGYDSWLQEFECEFMGSSNTLIPISALRGLKMQEPLLTYKFPALSSDNVIHEEYEPVKIYKKPENEHRYVITVDAGHGKGLDYSVCSVFDVTKMPYEQVAVFRDNNVSPDYYPKIISELGIMYNNAFILCELNDIGHSIVESLRYRFEYENMFTVGSRQGKQTLGGKEFGVKTSAMVKHSGCLSLRELVTSKNIVISDYDTIQELSRFVANDTGTKWAAESGANDDTVATLFLFGWLIKEPVFIEQYAIDSYDTLYGSNNNSGNGDIENSIHEDVPFFTLASDTSGFNVNSNIRF